MLASITPLGERSRRQRWWLTVLALIVGATTASAAVGAGLAAAGTTLGLKSAVRLDVLLALSAAAVLIDLHPFGLRLPSHRRQVDDEWLRRYRGWVYGFGFGAQLGVGLLTIVTTAAVYAMLAGELLAPTTFAGAAVGATFGIVRGTTVLSTVRVDSSERLAAFHARFHRAERPVAWLAVATQAAFIIGVVATL